MTVAESRNNILTLVLQAVLFTLPNITSSSSAWMKLALNLHNKLQVEVSKVSVLWKNNEIQFRFPARREQQHESSRVTATGNTNNAVERLTASSLLYRSLLDYKSHGSFDLDKRAGLVHRSVFRPSTVVFKGNIVVTIKLRGQDGCIASEI